MEIVFERGEASAADVRAALPDPPSYSAVRALLRILEEKGHLKHRESGGRYIFLPTQTRAKAGRSALRQVVRSFYNSSLEETVAALLDTSEEPISPEQAKRLTHLIRQSRKEGR